jgi:hypothetical protein
VNNDEWQVKGSDDTDRRPRAERSLYGDAAHDIVAIDAADGEINMKTSCGDYHNVELTVPLAIVLELLSHLHDDQFARLGYFFGKRASTSE